MAQVKNEKVTKVQPIEPKVTAKKANAVKTAEEPKVTRTKTTRITEKPKEEASIVRRQRRGKTQILGLFDNDEDMY